MKKYKAVALYSGGVDSSVAPILARKNIGDNILLLMISLGEPVEKIELARKRAEILGFDFHCIEGEKEFANQYLSEAIYMNGSYWGYHLITPLSRAFMVKKALNFLENELSETNYLIHGCTLYQNTKFRIEKHCSLGTNINPLGPLVLNNLSRKEKITILEEHNIECGPTSEIAEDHNIWGRALEGDPLNDHSSVEEKNLFEIICKIEDTPGTPDYLDISFERGLPISINKIKLPLHEIIIQCGKIGGVHGIGFVSMFEDTIPELGYKQKGVFESPASTIIYTCHKYIEDAIYTNTERKIKRQLEQEWGEIVYRGGWYDANRIEISNFIKPLQKRITGEVNIKLFKGNIVIRNCNIPESILLNKHAMKGTY